MLSWKPTTPSNWWLNPRPERVWGFFVPAFWDQLFVCACVSMRVRYASIRGRVSLRQASSCLCQSTLNSISDASDIRFQKVIPSSKWVPIELESGWNFGTKIKIEKLRGSSVANRTVPIPKNSKMDCEVKYSKMRYMSSLKISGIDFGTSWFLFKIKDLRGGYPVDIPKFQVPARTKGFESASLREQEPVTRCKAWPLKTPHNHSTH